MNQTYKLMKAAWDGPNRESRLHRVVEELAAEGTTLAEFDSAITELLVEIRAAGADEDTEEILLGVGDRLHGWCSRDLHIHTREGFALNGHSHPPLPVAAPR